MPPYTIFVNKRYFLAYPNLINAKFEAIQWNPRYERIKLEKAVTFAYKNAVSLSLQGSVISETLGHVSFLVSNAESVVTILIERLSLFHQANDIS